MFIKIVLYAVISIIVTAAIPLILNWLDRNHRNTGGYS